MLLYVDNVEKKMMHVLGDDDESREWLLNHTKSSYHTRVRDTEIIC